jgi:cytochrome c553
MGSLSRMGFPRRTWSALAVVGAALMLMAAAEEASKEKGPRAEAISAAEIELALALEPDTANGLRLYRECAECHQPEGWGKPDGSYPQLAGQHTTVIVKQLADIRAGIRGAPEMHGFVTIQKLGDAQGVADVAGYIDTLEISVNNGKGPGTDLAAGKNLYDAKCARCHGKNGEGDGNKYIPRIQAQHYEYLLRQFRDIRDGRRGNADEKMVEHTRGISDDQASAILDHVSRLEPPEWLQAPPGWENPDFP